MKRVRTRRWLAATSVLVLGGSFIVPSAHAAEWEPVGLSDTDLKAALASMTPTERAERTPIFTSDRYVVVAYTSTFQEVDAHGAAVGAPQRRSFGSSRGGGITSLGSASKEGLNISVSIAFDREAPPYRWDISAYFDWTKWPQSVGGEDSIGLAWANGLALNNDYAWGKYTYQNQNISPFYRSDGVPNVGTAWSFREWTTVCDIECWTAGYANYGWFYATIKENTLQNKPTNVMFKYFHTYQGIDYAVSFGSSPSISITPVQNVWSVVAFTSFTA